MFCSCREWTGDLKKLPNIQLRKVSHAALEVKDKKEQTHNQEEKDDDEEELDDNESDDNDDELDKNALMSDSS